MSYQFRWGVLHQYMDTFQEGLILTGEVCIISLIVSLFIGMAIAIGITFGPKGLKLGLSSYVLTFRSTPLLVQLYIAYFGLASWGITIPALIASIITLSLNCGAYMAEIIRGALQSIPQGQIDGGRALGLSFTQNLRCIILPQTFRIARPAIIGQCTYLVKDSSLLSAIGVAELTRAGTYVNTHSFRPLEAFAPVVFFYLVINLVIVVIGNARHTFMLVMRKVE